MKHSANTASKFVLTVVSVLVLSANLIEAAEIEVSVATDQVRYWPKEVLTVSVTAYNPNDYEVTLGFSSSFQASYIVDDAYDWSTGKAFTLALTQVTIGAKNSHTWDFNHDWEHTSGSNTYGYDLSIGTHTVVGALKPIGWFPDMEYVYYSQAAEFEVVTAPPPPTDILIDFDHYPDGDQVNTGRLWDQYSPWGVHFRTFSEDDWSTPTVQIANNNQYAKVNSTTYPPGFNLMADFDMPVYSIEVDVGSAVGMTVTMIAKDSSGAIIDSVVSDSVPDISNWFELKLETTTPIASVEWWPSVQNASVWIDNLHVLSSSSIPEPSTLSMLLALGVLALPWRRRLTV